MSQGCAAGLVALMVLDGEEGGRLGGFVGFSGWMPFAGWMDGFLRAGVGMEQGEGEEGKEGKEGDDSSTMTKTTTATMGKKVLIAFRHRLGIIGDDFDFDYGSDFRGDDSKESQALQVPIFLEHGMKDPIVSPLCSQQIREILQLMGMKVVLKLYRSCGHWIQEPEGYDDFVEFLGGIGIGNGVLEGS